MAEKSVFAYYPVFKGSERFRELPEGERVRAVEEAQALLEGAAEVQVRGIYSTVGFRPDADLMMWWVGPSADVLQSLLIELRRTRLGRLLQLTWAFLGLHRPAEFSPEHVPSFVKGLTAGKYVCVYPFVRTPEWYLLPPETRGRLLREHGELGRDFPDVLPNTTSAFGLGDYEWILAFESDRLESIVAMIRRLRDAEARRYTKLETPFVTGIRKPLAAAVADLT